MTKAIERHLFKQSFPYSQLSSIFPVTYQNIEGNEESSLSASRISSDLSPERRGGSTGWLDGPKGLLIGLSLGLGLAFAGLRLADRQPTAEVVADAPESQVASASVTTVVAERAPIRATITASGTVEAFDLLAVSSRASGLQIQDVRVREGDRVVAGQVLAVLDDSVLQAQIQQAEAQVSAAEAQVAQARAQVGQAEATAAEAQQGYERYTSLFEQGAVSSEALESRRTQLVTSRQSVDAAIASVSSAQASVRSAQADVDRLLTQLGQTEVIAPASGVIAEKTATVGDTASAGSPLFELISGDQLELALSIPQAQLASINPGASVQITSSADPNLQLQGSVRSIDPVVDAQSRKATVKVSLPDSERLRPGMFLQADIVTGSRQGVVVPAEAVLPQSSGGFVVYTLEDGVAVANVVEVGDRISARGSEPAKTEIVSGLGADDTVIVEGASYIQDGDTVNVVTDTFAN